MPVRLRPYTSDDADATLHLFRDAIRTTAAADYSAEQIDAWAGSGPVDGWDAKLLRNGTVVAEVDGTVAGFSDVDDDGYVDMMFVSPHHARTGVGSALLRWVEAEARRRSAARLTTHASETARPFFEAHGFRVDARRTPTVRGVRLHNYAMSKPLD